ncbi:MAG: hypothetical protein HDT43_08300 [Ruminococcaceae bacterium]|nr:hypothetical protein [Oscillospiraceae bacterium]
MKFGFKRIAAGALALAVTASLCGCGDNGYIMTVEDISIRNGIYLSFQQSAYSEAYEKIQEQNGSDDSSSDTSVIDVFSENVESKSAAEWIKEQTIKYVRRFVAVQKVCGELGITLTEDEIKEMNSDLQSAWDEENFYVQYTMGFNTLGEYYESFGVGIDSMKEIRKANALSDKLFLHYYDNDGEYPVSKDEINTYLTENYAAVKMLTLSYTDASGNALETDEEKQEIKDKAKAYADRINGGDSFIDVKYDSDLAAAQDSARASAESSYTEDNEEGLTKEEYIQKEVDDVDVTKAEKPEDLDQFISKDNSTLEEKLTEYIWNAAADGKAAVFEGEGAAYVVLREDVTTKDSWEEENHEDILKAIRNDDYDKMMEMTYQNYKVDLDEYLVNTKYAPEKMLKQK